MYKKLQMCELFHCLPSQLEGEDAMQVLYMFRFKQLEEQVLAAKLEAQSARAK